MDDGLQAEERALTMELDAERAPKEVLLNEAAHILADAVSVLKTDTCRASRVLPYATDIDK